MAKVGAYVVEAEVQLDDGCDPAALGAAVTLELCGAIEHKGPCRWPHNSEIDTAASPVLFRTLYSCEVQDEVDVRMQIEASLRAGDGWHVLSVRPRDIARSERALAQRLRGGPRAPAL